MKASFFLVGFGVFVLMALSNAIVPVLPAFAPGPAWEGTIYAAYFLGAFLSTLPGGILSDRYGRLPVIRAGLVLTVGSGFLLFSASAPFVVAALRLIEGIGAGFFIAAGMSFVNSQPDHTKLSGYYLAMLNLGLVIGLAAAGWLAVRYGQPALGIGVFTVLSFAALCVSIVARDDTGETSILCRVREPCRETPEVRKLLSHITSNAPLWYSAIVLVGITGVVTALYPAFSGYTADILGLWISGMSISTIGTVLIISRVTLPPIPAIRWSAVLMAVGAGIAYFSPLGFIILGALAGVVMVAQMNVLAGGEDQGCIMGLFSTSSYLGMTVLPFAAGLIAGTCGFPAGFLFAALAGGSVAVMLRAPATRYVPA